MRVSQDDPSDFFSFCNYYVNFVCVFIIFLCFPLLIICCFCFTVNELTMETFLFIICKKKMIVITIFIAVEHGSWISLTVHHTTM